MRKGFVRVAAACPPVNVADVEFNTANILRIAARLAENEVEMALFPEMCITAYTCADLFHQRALLEAAADGLERIRRFSELNPAMAIVVGLPRLHDGAIYNSAAIVCGGTCHFVDKSYLPSYNEFYEKRWFASGLGQTPKVFSHAGVRYGIEICEDLWAPVPPSSLLTLNGAQVVLNLSASDDQIGKYDYLRTLVCQQSARSLCGYVYAGAGFGESSTDLVFDGKAMIAENGTMLAEKPRWNSEVEYVIADLDIEAIERDRFHSTTFADCAAHYRNSATEEIRLSALKPTDEAPAQLRRRVDPHPFVPADDAAIDSRCNEIINIQVAGLARRLSFVHARRLVIGVSGGLDSTLALLVAVRAFDRLGLPRKGIIGVTMPGFGTTGRTRNNATQLMEELGVTSREISIVDAVNIHFRDIGQDPRVHDVTYENSQARERTQLLMDIANRENALVLGTGDLSELALGWATYNGDHMSMYAVNAGVPKTLVRYLVSWCAATASSEKERATLLDIIGTPISPELIPADEHGNIAQITEDLVGPYELHDFFLYYTLRYGFTPERIRYLARRAFTPEEYTDEVIDKWLAVFVKRFFSQQFKRSCMPDGPKVGSVCLSPRGDWRMPSDASPASFLATLR